MATPEENVETSASPPPAPVVESLSEEVVVAAGDETSLEVKKEEEVKKKGEGDLKSTLLISGAVVAVIGAILVIFKKVKEAA